jgi:hypothetical protein
LDLSKLILLMLNIFSESVPGEGEDTL